MPRASPSGSNGRPPEVRSLHLRNARFVRVAPPRVGHNSGQAIMILGRLCGGWCETGADADPTHDPGASGLVTRAGRWTGPPVPSRARGAAVSSDLLQRFATWPGRLIIGASPFPENIGASNATCATGAYVSYWRYFGNTLNAFGRQNSIIRLAWEANGNWFPWSAPTAEPDPKSGGASTPTTSRTRRATTRSTCIRATPGSTPSSGLLRYLAGVTHECRIRRPGHSGWRTDLLVQLRHGAQQDVRYR